jgi:hypothetical protein
MKLVNLTVLQAMSVSAQYRLGEVVRCYHATYGALKAIYCYFQDALTVLAAPINPDITAGWATSFTVDEDENESGVIGQEFCIGMALAVAVTTAARYGFVLVSGLNPVALTTDGNVTAGQTLIGSTTDGTWNGVTPTSSQAVAESGSASYTIVGAPMGKAVGMALADDASTAQAVGTAMINSVLAGEGDTL